LRVRELTSHFRCRNAIHWTTVGRFCPVMVEHMHRGYEQRFLFYWSHQGPRMGSWLRWRQRFVRAVSNGISANVCLLARCLKIRKRNPGRGLFFSLGDRTARWVRFCRRFQEVCIESFIFLLLNHRDRQWAAVMDHRKFRTLRICASAITGRDAALPVERVAEETCFGCFL